MDAAERFEFEVRLDELKALQEKRQRPHLILCFDPEVTLDYFRQRGWSWVDSLVKD